MKEIIKDRKSFFMAIFIVGIIWVIADLIVWGISNLLKPEEIFKTSSFIVSKIVVIVGAVGWIIYGLILRIWYQKVECLNCQEALIIHKNIRAVQFICPKCLQKNDTPKTRQKISILQEKSL